jgi:hypothetical protein
VVLKNKLIQNEKKKKNIIEKRTSKLVRHMEEK